MALLDRQQYFAAQKRTYEDVPMPELGGEIRVRGMTAREQIEFDQRIGLDSNYANMTAWVVSMTAVDADGNRLFTDGDAVTLGDDPAPLIRRLYEAATRLSRYSNAEIEQREKNSEASQG